MTFDEMVTDVRSRTNHDSDTQVTDTQIKSWVNRSLQRLRRKIALVAPELYSTVGSEQTLTGVSGTLTLPSLYETLIRLEIKVGVNWMPVDVSDGLTPHLSDLNFREEAGGLEVSPLSLAVGTFRIIYIASIADLTTGAVPVPVGCEEIIIEDTCALVRVRFEEDPTPHQMNSARCWEEQRPLIRRRYGNHPKPGMRIR